MVVGLGGIQPLSHGQGLSDDGSKLQLVVHLLRWPVDDGLRCLVGVGSLGLGVPKLAEGPLDVSARDDDGAGPALVANGEVEECGRRTLVVDDDPSGVFDVLEGAGEVWGVNVVLQHGVGEADLPEKSPTATGRCMTALLMSAFADSGNAPSPSLLNAS